MSDVAPDILDHPALRRNFDGDAEFLGRLLKKFEGSYPAQLTRIRERLAAGEGVAAAEEAHRVAGATSVFFAAAARHTALTLEDHARGGDLAAADVTFASLARELDRLAAALRALAASGDC